jgi:hypothetical protein
VLEAENNWLRLSCYCGNAMGHRSQALCGLNAFRYVIILSKLRICGVPDVSVEVEDGGRV